MFVEELRWSSWTLWMLAVTMLAIVRILATMVVAEPLVYVHLAVVVMVGASMGMIWPFSILRVCIDDTLMSIKHGFSTQRIALSDIQHCRVTAYQPRTWRTWVAGRASHEKVYHMAAANGKAIELRLVHGQRMLIASRHPAALCQTIWRYASTRQSTQATSA